MTEHQLNDAEFAVLVSALRSAHNPTTNADRIRAMSDEELAILLSNTDGDFPPGNAVPVRLQEQAWLDWLQSPAYGGDGDET